MWLAPTGVVAARRKTRCSARVTRESNALDLEPNVFELRDPRAIARSLGRLAERSRPARKRAGR